MISEKRIRKDVKGNGCGLMLRYYLGIFLLRTKENPEKPQSG
jgi:hypothetical protein